MICLSNVRFSEELYECARELLMCSANIENIFILHDEHCPYPIASAVDRMKSMSTQLVIISKLLNSKNYGNKRKKCK